MLIISIDYRSRKTDNYSLFYNNCIGVITIKEKLKNLSETLKSLKTKEGRREFYKKHKHIILYFVFGIGTTIVYMLSYYLTRLFFPDAESVPAWLRWIYRITDVFGIESNTALPVIVSWFLSVTFAIVTNRVYVFESQADTFGKVMLEAVKLYATRIATLFVNLLLMFLLVDLPKMHNFVYEFIAMIFTNIIVLILNYILSRIFVFRKKKEVTKKK